jgi:hypothetical protein
VSIPRNFQERFFRSFRMYLAIVLGLLSAYFVYVIASHGSTFAFSVENLKWFGSSLVFYSTVAGLVAALSCLTRTD